MTIEVNGIEIRRGMYFIHKRYQVDRKCEITGLGPKYMSFVRGNNRWDIKKVPVAEAVKIIEKVSPSDEDVNEAYREHILRLVQAHLEPTYFDAYNIGKLFGEDDYVY